MNTAHFTNIRQEILNELAKATSHIQVAVAWFTNQNLFDQLCQSVQQGVNVELIIIDDFINNGIWGLDFQHFIDLGGKLFYGNPENPMHHKFCIIDNQVVFNGSYNWTYYAETKNVENTVKFFSDQELINQFIGEFGRLKDSLVPATQAIKRPIEELELINLFSIRDYLAYDLVSKGKQSMEVKFVEAAARLLPNNQQINQEYQSLSKEMLQKKTIVSLGIKAIVNDVYDQLSIIIPKGTPVPVRKSNPFHTSYDNQTSAEIHTYKGDFSNVNQDLSIGSFSLSGLPPKPKGQASIEVTFSLNEQGFLTVEARSIDTNIQMKATYYLENLVH